MKKAEFLAALKRGLSGRPRREIKERLAFYGEMIDDRMEEGYGEEQAVAQIGTVDGIVAQIRADASGKGRVKRYEKDGSGRQTWKTVLLIAGFPVWLPLLIAAVAVAFSLIVAAAAIVFSLCVVLLSLTVVLWAVDLSLAAAAVAGVLGALLPLVQGNGLLAAASVGAGLFLAGAAIWLFYGCKAATTGLWIASVKTAALLGRPFAKRRA